MEVVSRIITALQYAYDIYKTTNMYIVVHIYRRSSGSGWMDGWTINFTGDAHLEVEQPYEMQHFVEAGIHRLLHHRQTLTDNLRLSSFAG